MLKAARPLSLLVGCFFLAQPADAAFIKIENGIRLTLDHAQVEVASVKMGIFRLRVSFDAAPKPSKSIFLEPGHTGAPWDLIAQNNLVGVKTEAGQLVVEQTTGAWTLRDATGKTVLAQGNLAVMGTNEKNGNDQITISIALAQDRAFQAYGSGNDNPKKSGLLKSDGNSHLGNGVAVIPYYWCTAGYSALGVTQDDDTPANWRADVQAGNVSWNFPGRTADLYLMPAKDLYEAARRFADLSGHPKVAPIWTFGYLQSRWGWTDKSYIDNTLKTFHDERLPVDAFIFDFECYTTNPDYALKPDGLPNFPDFRWNPALFPDPAAQIADYRKQGLHVVPIRKPRIGDSTTLLALRAKGWILSPANGAPSSGMNARVLDFKNPDVRTWYGDQLKPLIEDGVAGWWNDEGESTYTKYYYWNEAEYDALAKDKPNLRHWSVNRSFAPGLQRLGAASWTGDIQSTWEVLARTPTSLLNWSLAGQPYSTCDIGGFTGSSTPIPGHPHESGPTEPELMTRWVEAGVFMPIMRVHSSRRIPPHFPWLSGMEAENAMRKAIDLRYRLIPYFYSLAHEAHATGVPLMRPLVMEFPDDPKVTDLSSQWLIGSRLMGAPILQPGNNRSVYFPETMQAFEGMATYQRGVETIVTAALDEIPVYVRLGTILTLGPILQNTDQLPGGALDVQIYPGKDAAFTLVEDDGTTCDYEKGILRKTHFTWSDSARLLNWSQTGGYQGSNLFRQLHVSLFDPTGKAEKDADLKPSGQLSFEK